MPTPDSPWLARIATEEMKTKVADALAPLVGLPLSKMYRNRGAQFFEFGALLPGRSKAGYPILSGEYALRLDRGCGWRVVSADGVVVGSYDYWYADGKEERNDFDFEHPTVRDLRAYRFFDLIDSESLTLLDVETDPLGGLVLHLAYDHRIKAGPGSGAKAAA